MAEAFRAQAAHCDLSVVLQLVSSQWLTGRLVVESELAVEATIECFEGLPIGASCGPTQGLVALYEAFLVPQTQLTFFAQEVPAPTDGPLGEVMVLLLEACRRLDEWRSLSRQSVAADGEVPEGTAPGLKRLWDRLDGTRQVGPLVAELGLVRAEVVDPLREWLRTGRVAPVTPTESPPKADVARPDVVAELARGRAQVRGGDIPGAIASFQQALALDPHHLLAQQHLLRLRELHPELFAPETPR